MFRDMRITKHMLMDAQTDKLGPGKPIQPRQKFVCVCLSLKPSAHHPLATAHFKVELKMSVQEQ